jgi:hypothetical protein
MIYIEFIANKIRIRIEVLQYKIYNLNNNLNKFRKAMD